MEIKKQKKNNLLTINKKQKCPICKQIAKEPFTPFCSKKCASLDLLKWLNDEYQSNLKSE